MSSNAPTSRSAALDPRCLGRPVHLLPRVTEGLRDALQRGLCLPWNRRYRTRYEMRSVALLPLNQTGAELPGRWLRTQGPLGPLACQIDRALVLSLMARRLGLASAPSAHDGDPSTATEERLQQAVALQLCGQSIHLLAQAAVADSLADSIPAPTLAPLQAGGAISLPADGWILELRLWDAEAQPPTDMIMRVALDGAYVAPVLRHLAGPGRAPKNTKAAQPLPRRLTLKMQARLLERELPLGDVLDLRPGALIPVRLADATLMVDGSPLMSAAVAEHQGKLCLTSFQDLE